VIGVYVDAVAYRCVFGDENVFECAIFKRTGHLAKAVSTLEVQATHLQYLSESTDGLDQRDGMPASTGPSGSGCQHDPCDDFLTFLS
jgi:hypothetical protein